MGAGCGSRAAVMVVSDACICRTCGPVIGLQEALLLRCSHLLWRLTNWGGQDG